MQAKKVLLLRYVTSSVSRGEFLKTRGWSQEKLALESGLAQSYLGGIERGQRNIALLNIFRLAETLKVPASALMDFEDLS